MPLDPKTEVEFTNSLTEARESIKKLEGTTKRIRSIIDNPLESENLPAPKASRRRARKAFISIRFAIFSMMCTVVILGMFGVLFFQYTEMTTAQVKELSQKVAKLERVVRDSQPAVNVTPPPSRNEVK